MLTTIRNWAEVWSLLIPLCVLAFQKSARPALYPLFLYVIIAFLLNFIATIIFVFHKQLPAFLHNNNVFYNLHSIARVTLIGSFFFRLKLLPFTLFHLAVFVCYLVFVPVNFLFFESIFRFSNTLFTIESILLLLICVQFLYQAMQDDSRVDWIKQPAFLVCMGIGLYEAVNFFIFLAFYDLAMHNKPFGKLTMTIHNLTFVIFCVLLALAFYRNEQKQMLHA